MKKNHSGAKNRRKVQETPSQKRFLREMSKIDLISVEEEIKLAKKKDSCVESRHKLILANIRFTYKLVKQVQQAMINSGSFVDGCLLMSFAAEGVSRALDKFNHTLGFKFISFGVWQSKQLLSLISKRRVIHLPANKRESVISAAKINNELQQSLERTPAVEEIAMKMDIDAKELSHAIQISKNYFCLDKPLAETEDCSLMDIIPDTKIIAPESSLKEKSLTGSLVEMVDKLEKRQGYIISHYYGLGKAKKKSLEEISQTYNLTKERVRQMLQQAIEALRRNSKKDRLLDYL